ncbi:unnamed protein product, partial [Phaeothamnion confervicola]
AARVLRRLSLHPGSPANLEPVLAALLTPGGLATLRGWPEAFVTLAASPLIEAPRVVWTAAMRRELMGFLLPVAVAAADLGTGNNGSSGGAMLRFVFASLADELVVSDVYVRVLVQE